MGLCCSQLLAVVSRCRELELYRRKDLYHLKEASCCISGLLGNRSWLNQKQEKMLNAVRCWLNQLTS